MLYRQVQPAHRVEWQNFVDSGLYAALLERELLVAHHEVDLEQAYDERAWRVLRPRQLDFISYPYEWTFGQLKDAALLTLEVQALAMSHGMTLRDASAYNVQFERGRPILIDALSFERLGEDEPWQAYRQFCQHFLAPLALMAQRDIRAGLLLRDFVDGLPLDFAAGLLPASSRLRLGLATHLHLHARAQRQHAGSDGAGNAGTSVRRARLSREKLEALIDSLRSTISGLDWQPAGTEWSDYGETTSYSQAAAASKAQLVEEMLGETSGEWVWDLGANTGYFSRMASDTGRRVLALDADAAAAEQHYRYLREVGNGAVLPLVVDLANPSPAIGWAGRERKSLLERANADVLIALALVHHLAISNNVPLPMVSSFFAQLGGQLIVEFVPKSDRRVADMLASREDIFDDYTLDGFRAAFAADWEVASEHPVADSERVLFSLRRR